MATLTTAYQLLAQSGYYTFLSAYGGKVCLRLYARVGAQSVSGNTSTVDIKLTKYLTGSSASVQYSCYQKDATLSGDLSHTWSDGGYATFHALSEYILFEKSFTVSHNADGTKSLSLAASYDDSYIAALTIGTVVCTLPTIARKSEIGGVSLSGGAIEQGFSVDFTPASTAFTHTLTLLAGGQTVAARSGYAAGATVALSGSELLTLYRALGHEGSATVQLQTQNGSTVIGQSTATLALTGLGNIHLCRGGDWRRGLLYVGNAPAVVMVRAGGEWRPAR